MGRIRKVTFVVAGLFLNLVLLAVSKESDGKKDRDTVKHHIPHVRHSGENWARSFAWNLIGYGIIVVPGFFFIRMIQKSNFYEKEGEGFIFRLIQCCVFGNVNKQDSPFSFIQKSFLCFGKTSSSAAFLRLVFCVAGLQCSYLTWGVLQEKVMTTKYGEGDSAVNFHDSEFLVFMNRIIAFIVAGIYIFTTGPNWSGPFYRYSFASLSNICSSWCQYEALKYVSFPTQVLGKASKMIPVMIMGKFINKKSYQKYEYIVAVMISVGVSMFLLATSGNKHTNAETTFVGFLLMIGYMGFDSFTSNWQSQLFSEYKLSSVQMMFNVNCFSCIFTLVSLTISGALFRSVAFMMEHPDFMVHVSIISIASSTGQLFIFYTIAEFGPLVFTTIMVTRQMLAILLSCIIYNHVLTAQAILGVMVVFVALFLQVYVKYRIKQKEKQRQQAIATRQGSDMA